MEESTRLAFVGLHKELTVKMEKIENSGMCGTVFEIIREVKREIDEAFEKVT